MLDITNLKIALTTIYISGFTALFSISPVGAETQINCVNPTSNVEYKDIIIEEINKFVFKGEKFDNNSSFDMED